MGISISPARRTLPASENTFVPLLVLVPMPANASPPWRMIHGTMRQRLDVVNEGGLAPQPGLRGERRAQARHSPAAFHRGDQGRLFTADESAGAFLDGNAQRVIAPQETIAQPAAPLALGQRGLHPPQGLGILVADVEDGFVRADRYGGDGQPLDDPIREGLEDHPVHERPRVAFVAVANHVFGFAGLLPHQAPFLARGKPRAPAPAQAGSLDSRDDFLGQERSALRTSDFGLRTSHPQAPGQCRKSIVCQILLEVQRIEPPIVLHGDVDLPVKERPQAGIIPAQQSSARLAGPPRHLPPASRPPPSSKAVTRGARGRAGGSATARVRRPGSGSARRKSRSTCPARRPRPSASYSRPRRSRRVSPLRSRRSAPGSAARHEIPDPFLSPGSTSRGRP